MSGNDANPGLHSVVESTSGMTGASGIDCGRPGIWVENRPVAMSGIPSKWKKPGSFPVFDCLQLLDSIRRQTAGNGTHDPSADRPVPCRPICHRSCLSAPDPGGPWVPAGDHHNRWSAKLPTAGRSTRCRRPCHPGWPPARRSTSQPHQGQRTSRCNRILARVFSWHFS